MTKDKHTASDKHKWVGGYRLGHPAIAQDKYHVIADCGHECKGYETRVVGNERTICPDCVPTMVGALQR